MSKVEKIFVRCDGCRVEKEIDEERSYAMRSRPLDQQWVRVYVGESTTPEDYCPECWKTMSASAHTRTTAASAMPCTNCGGRGTYVRNSGTVDSMETVCFCRAVVCG